MIRWQDKWQTWKFGYWARAPPIQFVFKSEEEEESRETRSRRSVDKVVLDPVALVGTVLNELAVSRNYIVVKRAALKEDTYRVPAEVSEQDRVKQLPTRNFVTNFMHDK